MARTGNIWKRRTHLEKFLIVAALVLCVSTFILFVWPCRKEEKECPDIKCTKASLTQQSHKPSELILKPKNGDRSEDTDKTYDDDDDEDDDDDDPCLTAQCVKQASEILGFIDPSADPCEDYYQFFCGTFTRNAFETRIPTLLLREKRRVENQIIGLLTRPISDEDSSALVLEKRFFEACMDVKDDDDDDDHDEIFMGLIEQIGGWPVLEENETESDFDWVEAVMVSRQLGLPFEWFLDLGVRGDDMNDFYISNPQELSVLSDEQKYLYMNLMTAVAVHLNASFDTDEEVGEVIDFQQALASICDENEGNDTSDTVLKDLQELSPDIDWVDFLTNITGNDTYFTLETPVDLNMGYFPRLDELLSRTPKEVQANYFVWKTIEYFSQFLSKPIREAFRKYQRYTDEDPDCGDNSRFKFCIGDTLARFNFVAEAEYIRRSADNETTAAVEEMVDLLTEEFVHRIESSSWMDEETKAYNQMRANTVNRVIGGQEEIFDEDGFDAYLSMNLVEFSPDANIIEMIAEKNKADLDAMFDAIGDESSPAQNAMMYRRNIKIKTYFDEHINTITIPAAILQGIFFDDDSPGYVNYGRLGSLVGNDLAQGYSPEPFYNTSGDEVSKQWSDESTEAFRNASRCIVEEYEDFDPGIPQSDEIEILEENFANRVGVDAAYSAYQEWAKRHGEEKKLPAVPYTPNQLFWISWSSLMCYQKLDDFQADVNAERATRFGIWALLRNSKNFGEDFQCPEGSPMNPREKCQVF